MRKSSELNRVSLVGAWEAIAPIDYCVKPGLVPGFSLGVLICRFDRATVSMDLIDGQYSKPARVVAFNTAQGWSRDVSAELAEEIIKRCAMDGFDVPTSLEGFVDRHGTTRARRSFSRCAA